MIARNPPSGNTSNGARKILAVAFRQKVKMFFTFVTILGLVLCGLIFFPRSYRSEARVFVRMGKESVALDPTATLSQTVEVDGSRESEINSEIDLLKSRVLMEDVVKKLGPEEILGQPSEEQDWMETVMTPVNKFAGWLTGPITVEEQAVNKLSKGIQVVNGRKSNILSIKYTARNPHKAQRLLDAFVEAYLMRHMRANQTPGSYNFLVEQSTLLNNQLEKASADLRDAKNASELVSVEGERDNVLTQASLVETARLENQRSLASSEAKIDALQKAMDKIPAQLVAEETSGLPNVAADQMRNELYKLEILERDFSSRFTAEHPAVIALQLQLADTRAIHGQQEGARSQATRKLNTVHQQLQTELAVTQALAASHRADAKLLEEQHKTVKGKMQRLNQDDFQISSLNRKTTLLESTYLTYAKTREQARIDQALEAGRVSNINVVQPASFVAKPASPSILVGLLLSVAAALAGAIGVAYLAELLDKSVKTPEQVEQELGIPVLLAVPRGVRHEVLEN